MGQKIHPNGIRLGIVSDWTSKWYADSGSYADLLNTDLEVRETKHLYLKQRSLRQELSDWIDSKTDWPILTTSIAKKWLNDGDGLQDRGITRDLDWGIPVKKGTEDWPGMEGKVFYVWFDAPIEYIACAAEWALIRAFPENVLSVSSGSGRDNAAAESTETPKGPKRASISRCLPALWVATTIVSPVKRRVMTPRSSGRRRAHQRLFVPVRSSWSSLEERMSSPRRTSALRSGGAIPS